MHLDQNLPWARLLILRSMCSFCFVFLNLFDSWSISLRHIYKLFGLSIFDYLLHIFNDSRRLERSQYNLLVFKLHVDRICKNLNWLVKLLLLSLLFLGKLNLEPFVFFHCHVQHIHQVCISFLLLRELLPQVLSFIALVDRLSFRDAFVCWPDLLTLFDLLEEIVPGFWLKLHLAFIQVLWCTFFSK